MPAVYAWLSRHPKLVDTVPAFGLALLGVPSAPLLPVWLLLLIIAGLAIPVVFRRRYPVQAFAVAVCAGAVQVLIYNAPIGTDLAILVLLYTLAAYRPRQVSVPGLAVCLVGAVTAVAVWVPRPIGAVGPVPAGRGGVQRDRRWSRGCSATPCGTGART